VKLPPITILLSVCICIAYTVIFVAAPGDGTNDASVDPSTLRRVIPYLVTQLKLAKPPLTSILPSN
jgi:hypothetical protein